LGLLLFFIFRILMYSFISWMISPNLFLVALFVSIREYQRVVQSLFRVKFLSSPAVMQPAAGQASWDQLIGWWFYWKNCIVLTRLVVCQFCFSEPVVYFFTAIGSEDIISIVHMYLAFFRFQLLDSRYVPTVLVQLIQKILICKVLNSCTKRKLHEQESRTTQFRVPPWKPDGLGAPGSYRVELIGVTPLSKTSTI
jgi:hypothetical protein